MAEEEVVEPEPVAPLSEEDFENRKGLFDSVFADCPAQDVKQKSLAERKENGLEGVKSLTYSELEISTVHRLLELVKEKGAPLYAGKGVFVDLGSGAGKACVAAGLLHSFEKVAGVELLQCLNDVAEAAKVKYADAQLPEGVAKPALEFVKGDFVMEFDDKAAPLAEQATVALCVATCFGEEQLAAMSKFAEKMPAGSIFITFTQELPESLLVDINKNPKQRRAAAVKKALATRGKAPEGVEVVLESAPNNPQGWKKLHCEEMELMWGATTCYMFKKYDYPFCNPGELCMATDDDGATYPAKFADATHATFLDDAAEVPGSVGKIHPFTEEAFQRVMEQFKAVAAESKKAEMADPKEAVAAALKKVTESLGPLAAGDKVGYATTGARNKESQALVEALAGGVAPLTTAKRAADFMLSKWDAACKEVDKEGSGAVSEQEAADVWKLVKGEYIGLIASKVKELEEWRQAHPAVE